MSKIEFHNPQFLVFMAEDTFAPLFWDDKDVGIGDVDSFYIGENEYDLSSLIGLKEWFSHADRYDPYSAITDFNRIGMGDWINQGYEFAKQIRKMIPKEIDLYYSFWHQFNTDWKCCRVLITL
ncbi:MAG: hypothetical protein IKX35_06745 [Bacteroidales bacterium]|nr:hypothetical protein [Bacteroidales bacterium]MBR6438614.1 hypothetical protein [Bacteroidales bacterium]